jgi:hypothetical protein
MDRRLGLAPVFFTQPHHANVGSLAEFDDCGARPRHGQSSKAETTTVLRPSSYLPLPGR